MNWFKKLILKIMGVIKRLLFRMKKAVAHLTLSTTSTSATWSPSNIIKTGDTLVWNVTGDIAPTSQTLDEPIFDLSLNSGTVDIDFYSADGLTELYLRNLFLTSLNVDSALLLNVLHIDNNSLTSINVSQNINLTNIQIYTNNIPSIDLSNNLNITNVAVYENNMSPSATDQIYIDCANGIGINGYLSIRNNRTSASDSARATLASRGWGFAEFFTT